VRTSNPTRAILFVTGKKIMHSRAVLLEEIEFKIQTAKYVTGELLEKTEGRY
jgi:hypothetical protein